VRAPLHIGTARVRHDAHFHTDRQRLRCFPHALPREVHIEQTRVVHRRAHLAEDVVQRVALLHPAHTANHAPSVRCPTFLQASRGLKGAQSHV